MRAATMPEPYIPVLRDLSDITPEIARHVLAHFGCEGGYRAGSFTMSLIDTVLYFRVQTAEGSAALADVTIFYQPLP